MNDITARLDKGLIELLVRDVIDPFYRQIAANPKTKEFVKDPALLRGLKIKQTTFAVFFIVYPLDNIVEKVKKSSSIHDTINLKMEYFVEYFFVWNSLLEEFIKKNILKDEKEFGAWEAKFQKLLWIMSGSYKNKDLGGKIEDIAEVETIESHSFESKKLSAKEFLEEFEMEQDTLDELQELYTDFRELFDMNEELNGDMVDSISSIFRKYGTVLDATVEFMDLGAAFIGLSNDLEIRKEDILKSKNAKIAKMFFVNIVEDLDSWRKNIFITQEARDIHYLDDSLFSSLAQLELALEDREAEGDLEDVFF